MNSFRKFSIRFDSYFEAVTKRITKRIERSAAYVEITTNRSKIKSFRIDNDDNFNFILLVQVCPLPCATIFNLWKSVNTIALNWPNMIQLLVYSHFIISDSVVIIVRLINLCDRIIDCERCALQILQSRASTVELQKLNKLTFCLPEIIRFCRCCFIEKQWHPCPCLCRIIFENWQWTQFLYANLYLLRAESLFLMAVMSVVDSRHISFTNNILSSMRFFSGYIVTMHNT